MNLIEKAKSQIDALLQSAYAAAGRSGQEKLILDAVFAHGGSCPVSDLQALFGSADPARSLSSLVKKGVLLTDSREKRRVGTRRSRQLEGVVRHA